MLLSTTCGLFAIFVFPEKLKAQCLVTLLAKCVNGKIVVKQLRFNKDHVQVLGAYEGKL